MRRWMIDMRIKKGLNCNMAAKKGDCSTKLLELLEYDDSITHPICAARLAAVYGMSVDQYNQIVHEKHRTDVLPEPAPPAYQQRLVCVCEENQIPIEKGRA